MDLPGEVDHSSRPATVALWNLLVVVIGVTRRKIQPTKGKPVHRWFLRAAVAIAILLGMAPVMAVTAQTASAAESPIAPPLRHGVASRTWTVPHYIAAWERFHDRRMTAGERHDLARGCIGVTVVNLDREDVGNPPLYLSFGRLETAERVRDALNEIVQKHPSPRQYDDAVRANPLLNRLENVAKALPRWISTAKLKAVIFSKRFYSKQNPQWSDEHARKVYRPDPATDQVDMSTYRYRAKPGYVNFDYGWFDQQTGSWWHANHSEPGMEVYQSTLKHYSRPLLDFDEQVFSVAFAGTD
ncbi:hypothetical protein [Amycolatopsis sp. NPDC058986]|uniref:hypothetical protein n=1 Tax=unclassified Amycolatopsis TaxID=2618356 RepID=UPI003670AA57